MGQAQCNACTVDGENTRGGSVIPSDVQAAMVAGQTLAELRRKEPMSEENEDIMRLESQSMWLSSQDTLSMYGGSEQALEGLAERKWSREKRSPLNSLVCPEADESEAGNVTTTTLTSTATSMASLSTTIEAVLDEDRRLRRKERELALREEKLQQLEQQLQHKEQLQQDRWDSQSTWAGDRKFSKDSEFSLPKQVDRPAQLSPHRLGSRLRNDSWESSPGFRSTKSNWDNSPGLRSNSSFESLEGGSGGNFNSNTNNNGNGNRRRDGFEHRNGMDSSRFNSRDSADSTRFHSRDSAATTDSRFLSRDSKDSKSPMRKKSKESLPLSPEEQEERDRALAAEARAHREAQVKVEAFLKRFDFHSVTVAKQSMMGKLYPLHVAVRENEPEVVAALVRCGADKESKNSSGKTPLEVAAKLNRKGSHDAVIAALL